jgi:S-(hydroxymethyl)glutathione dehydrogenase/alcohol dehydrogenase
MKTKAALIYEAPSKWLVEEVELDDPKDGEVLVRMVGSGLCHSDDHMTRAEVRTVRERPICGGHEGGAVVEKIGRGVETLKVGDHVVTSFIPACGYCRWCASGYQNLCDNGRLYAASAQLDGTYRMHHKGADVGTAALLGTFAEYQVFDERSCVKVDKDLPLDVVCLLGCGVPTGWGGAVNGGEIKPGDVVIVMGVGGIGINAVQGAAHAGAAHVIAVDPVEFKRTESLKLGATEAFADMEAATEFARSITNGQGADSSVICTSLIQSEYVGEAFSSIRKGGTVVVTAQGNYGSGMPINLFEISMYQKRIQGNLSGMISLRRSIPQLVDLYRSGQLKLDEIITRRYRLDQVNQGYDDMWAGINIRGVIDFGN